MLPSQIKELIQFACDANGRPDISKMIKVQWSNRMTRAMGTASKRLSESHYTIKLSVPLFARATEEQKRQTVIHEACHVIDAVINGVRMSHGHTWKRCMRKCGVKPERCHTVPCDGLTKRWAYHCPKCKAVFQISTVLHNRISFGRTRICRRCRTTIERGLP